MSDDLILNITMMCLHQKIMNNGCNGKQVLKLERKLQIFLCGH